MKPLSPRQEGALVVLSAMLLLVTYLGAVWLSELRQTWRDSASIMDTQLVQANERDLQMETDRLMTRAMARALRHVEHHPEQAWLVRRVLECMFSATDTAANQEQVEHPEYGAVYFFRKAQVTCAGEVVGLPGDVAVYHALFPRFSQTVENNLR